MAGAHTQHSKASLTSGLIWRCQNVRTLFLCTEECLKSTQQANPIEVWTICAHMWVRPSVYPSMNNSPQTRSDANFIPGLCYISVSGIFSVIIIAQITLAGENLKTWVHVPKKFDDIFQ